MYIICIWMCNDMFCTDYKNKVNIDYASIVNREKNMMEPSKKTLETLSY